ncbi:MAG: PASTA domain-containing protein [Pyrinomonadaceae bacterium]
MNTSSGALSALGRLTIVIAVAIVFIFGLATTVYLSLRSPEVKVPDVVGKERFEAERILGNSGLNFRVRAVRPSNQLSANTVLFQLPRPGEVVKAGQTVAMDISRTAKEGETSEAIIPEKKVEERVETVNTNESASANENKTKRNKNTNKNANDNLNSNNRNANTNRSASNKNTNSVNANRATNANLIRPPTNGNTNVNRTPNQNSAERPAVAKPSPVSRPSP